MNELNAIFVYGTLKRGEEREHCWPRTPLAVEPAVTSGRLFDIGPYPAMIAGDDQVLGELWRLRSEDMAETLRALDAVECYGQDEVDLYERRVIECRLLNSGELVRAHTYFFANVNELRCLPLATKNSAGMYVWSRRHD